MSEETTVVADDDKYVKFGTMKKMFESFYELMPKSYQSINITFDAGEGGLFDDGQQTLATTGYSGQKLKLPEVSPSRTGYTFTGWFTQDGTAVDNTVKNGTEDITYYAHWTANTYHVILVQNDGTGNEGILPVTYGELFSLAAMPTRTGYTALGYFDSQNDGEGVKYINADGSGAKAFDKTETVILYVHWQANTYTVSLNGNYSGAPTSTISVTYGSTPENIQIPERVGYWFMGYSSDPSVISDDTKYFDNTGAATKTWSIDDQDVVLYAIWSVKEIQIALNSGYPGGGDSQYITITFGSTNSTVEIPERDGYTFLGYYDAENEGGTQWFDGNGALVRPWNIDSTTYLYAHWEAIAITVTLDGNYDGAISTSISVVPGEVPANIAVPVRGGYDFIGYYDAATDGIQYFTNTGVATSVWSSTDSDIVLYAHWEIITIGVTLDGNYDGAMASQFFIVPGSTPENIEIPVRDGYNFLGYYSTATDGTQYFTSEGVATDAWSSITSAIVLYAHWERGISTWTDISSVKWSELGTTTWSMLKG